MREGIRRRRPGRALTVVAIVVLATGCIGTHSRTEFEQIVRERGGGVSASSIADLRAAFVDELGTDDPEIRSLTVNFGSGTAVVEARNPAAPDELDRYTFRNGEMIGVDPVRLDDTDDLDHSTVAVSALGLDRVESMADRALAEFDATGGYVTTLRVSARREPIRIAIDVESPRSAAGYEFALDGSIVVEGDR